jgi:hypothetical protein
MMIKLYVAVAAFGAVCGVYTTAPAAQAEPGIIPGITVMTIVKWSGTTAFRYAPPTGSATSATPSNSRPVRPSSSTAKPSATWLAWTP